MPEPQPGETQPYYNMFRWGANANLARIHEARKDDAAAIDYYTRYDPTSQHAGNLLRARAGLAQSDGPASHRAAGSSVRTNQTEEG